MENYSCEEGLKIAMSLAGHVRNPCGCEVDGKWENIRDFYLREARRVLPMLTGEFARKFLEETLADYEVA